MCADRPEGFRSIPSATGGIARLACTRLREAGKDVSAVLAKAGVAAREIEDVAVRLDVSAQIRILDLAAAELGDDVLGFNLARSFDLREIGLAYYIIASSRRLRDAQQNAARYSRIANEGVRLNFSVNETAVIALDYTDVDRRSDRHQIEFWLVTLVRVCRQVTDVRLVPVQVKLRHSRAGTPADIKAFLGCDITFDAGADEVHFPAEAAELPIKGHDTFLNKLLRRYAEEAIASSPILRSGFRGDVERVLALLLPHGKARISEVARELGMSARTLSRRLQGEGVTFAAILDDLRAALARRYLADADLPVTEIAWLLGYRETSSFTHAFKRRTGLSPRQFRASEG